MWQCYQKITVSPLCYLVSVQDKRWCRWLRHCAGSTPDGVIGIFHWHNPSIHTLALGLTRPLTEMNNWNISWGGKDSRCIRLTTLPPSCAECLEIWEPQPPGTLRACNGIALPFTYTLLYQPCCYFLWTSRITCQGDVKKLDDIFIVHFHRYYLPGV
jgi:hypothetical protein